MDTPRTCLILILVNLALLGLQFAHGSQARSDTAAPIVRTRALELVDAVGRVRAELKVAPAQTNLKMPDGTTGYPEAVQLRLITSQSSPNVKLATTEDGAGLVLGGDKGYIQLLSRSSGPIIKIATNDGREKTIAVE